MLDTMARRVPFYEYRRPDGTILEVMQKMTDPPLAEDPETGVPLERVFHPIAVHFKGKGFYNTDYGTKKRAREKAETESDSARRTTPTRASDVEEPRRKSDSTRRPTRRPRRSSTGDARSPTKD